MKKKHSGQTRPVQVMSKQSGESKMVDVPVIDRDRKWDSTQMGEHPDSCQPAQTKAPVENIPTDVTAVKGKEKEIPTLGGFIESFYAGKTRSLPEKMVKILAQKPTLDPDMQNQLIEMAAKADVSLEKSRHLLLLAAHIEIHKLLARTLRDFVRSVVMKHPLLEQELRDDWFPSGSETPPRPIRQCWEWSHTKLKSGHPVANDKSAADNEKKAAAEMGKARRSIFFSTLLWRYSEKQLSFVELIRELRGSTFELNADQDKVKFETLEFLVLSQEKDKQGIASLMRWFHDQVSQAKVHEDHERNRASRLQDEVQAGQELLYAKQAEIDGLKQEIEALRKQLEAVKEEGRVSGVHFRDDLERQRSRTLRALDDEIPVLKDCLTALDRDPPKVEIAKEYLGTALDNLNEELKQLRGN
jgi:hypothetical protein